MIVLIALTAMALLAGVFYGLGSSPRRRALWVPPTPAALPPANALPGGDPLRPIRVISPVVIDRHAERWPCPRCQSPVHCDRHRADQHGDRRLRIAEVRCRQCGYTRDVYFELTDAQAN